MTHTVLLVDDEPNVLRAYLRAMRKQPHKILTARDAVEAIETITTCDVDVIVSDEKMPGMSGTELLTWVAENYPDIVRMLLTGHATFDIAMRAINEGKIYRFLTKPCDDVELAMTIRKALEYKDLCLQNRELLEQTQRQVRDIDQARQHAVEQARQLQLRTEELKISRIKADEANEAKSAFLANMSHEIRTPMNAILGFSQLLLKAPLAEEYLENVGYINSAGKSLLLLINDILDFSKIEAGQLTLNMEHFSPQKLLHELARLGKSLVGDKPVRVVCQLDSSVPDMLYGDSGRLRQILLNLVSNAVKFTEQGDIRICVTVAAESHQNVTVRFEVSDTGIGVPEDRQAAIFDSFTQADQTTTRQYGGTGLGLAICKQLVSLMGGDIGVRSKVGKGSTFWFNTVTPNGLSKPATDDETNTGTAEWFSEGSAVDETIIETFRSESSIGDETEQPPYRLLLVDDSPLNRKLLVRLLHPTGCSIDEASTGTEAITRIESASYDLILMDVQMPEMDGLEVTRCVRQREEASDRHVTIVAVTAHALKGDRERCLEAGMDDYLAKPITEEALYEVMSRHLSRFRSSVRAPRHVPPESFGQMITSLEKTKGKHSSNPPAASSESFAELMPDLRGALQQKNSQHLERIAHSLKNLASQSDSEQTSLDAFRVELAARRKNWSEAALAVTKLEENVREYETVSVSSSDSNAQQITSISGEQK